MIDPAALRDLFDRAASLPPSDRASFLAAACGGNEPLRREVERLLDADARLGSVLESEDAVTPSSFGRAAEASRALGPGIVLGPYIIDALVGAGGMGEVYRAHDPRLGRTVAIKVLPAALTQDPTARQRLEREARAAAALAHPHICTLLDIGRQGDIDFLVMEYLDGETLAARLQRGKLTIGIALTSGVQIASALGAAHRAAIVHRDLKPGNIMLTSRGAMLLDFGLARETTQAPVDLSTMSLHAPLTGEGTILGTVQYMAPEQLEGKPADPRTDIFALGVVLFEMATGRRAFVGSSQATVIGNILNADPPSASAIVPQVPSGLDRLIRRCLAKDPADRWQTVSDVQARLEAIQDAVREGSGADLKAADTARPSSRWRIGLAAVGIVAAGVLGAAGWWLWPRAQHQSSPSIAARPSVSRNLTRLTTDPGLQTDPTLSPDGRFFAYASDRIGNFDIWVQSVGGGDPVQVTKSPAADTEPSWSPDGASIVFRSERYGGGLYVVPALGGPERLVVNRGVHPVWSDDGQTIRFQAETAAGNGLYEISPQGNAPRPMAPAFAALGRWLWIGTHPDGRISFLGYHQKGGYGFFTISSHGVVIDSHIARHAPSDLINMKHSDGQRFRWTSGRELILETEANNGVQNIWKVSVDPVTLEWTSFERLTTGGGADVAATLSPDGQRILFSTQRMPVRLRQFAFDRARARLSDVQSLTEDLGVIFGADVTSDGLNVAFSGAYLGTDQIAVWRESVASRRPEFLADLALSPVWAADRRSLAYIRALADTKDPTRIDQPAAIAVRPGGGAEQLISPWSTQWLGPTDWMDNGRTVLVCQASRIVTWPVTQPLSTSPSRVVFDSGGPDVRQAKISPNGHWLSFVVGGSGRAGIGVTSASGTPQREWTTVARDHPGAAQPRWSPDGRTLYFLSPGPGRFENLWSIRFDPDRGHSIGVALALTDFQSPAFVVIPSSLNVLERQVFMSIRSTTGNIWMLNNIDH